MRAYAARILAFCLLASLLSCTREGAEPRSAVIERRVAQAIEYMYREIPGSKELAQDAAGVLVMPVITEASLNAGIAYGEGVLLINGAPVDYYSATQASFGFQIGYQLYSSTLFFMTEEALRRFRESSGWEVAGGVEYAVSTSGGTLQLNSTTTNSQIIGIIYARTGLLLGASLEGTKYTRILR